MRRVFLYLDERINSRSRQFACVARYPTFATGSFGSIVLKNSILARRWQAPIERYSSYF
jgi:hypothetical protein